jgi:hypothetical protein
MDKARSIVLVCFMLGLSGTALAVEGAPVAATTGAPINAHLGPVKFFAELSAAEQSATTESPGIGRADFLLDRETVRLSWKVTYSKLTSAATGAHIHGPQRPGTNAGVQVDLAPKGMAPPLEGSAILTDAQLEYLLAGRMYVNIHSVKYPPGELRGQIQRVPPTKQQPTQ